MTTWLRHRSFQTRVSLLVVAAVGTVSVLAAAACYFAVSHQLYKQVDSNLVGDAGQFQTGTGAYTFNATAAYTLLSHDVLVQLIDSQGKIDPLAVNGTTTTRLTPTSQELAICRLGSSSKDLISTTSAGGQDYRVMTVPIVNTAIPAALQIAQPLTNVESTLATLRLILVTVFVASLLIAVLLGLTVAGATLRPVRRLTQAAEHVAATQQLDAAVPAEADDELGRLANAFNRMLSALKASRHQQAQLVSDAGHELRTPLTSLRTNVEFLARAGDGTLPEAERRELLTDITAQVGELTTLVGDLVELARQDEQQPVPVEARLDHIVARAVDRARRRAPGLDFDVRLEPGSILGQPPLLERAVLNVLDNAAKFSPAGGTVAVRLGRSDRWVLEVRDHGPGIAPEDLPRVFDRFYRASSARWMPGSGLGLAIVSQVVTSHGGTVGASAPDGGGTLVRIELPVVAEQEPPASLDPPPAAENQPAPAQPAGGV